jgi:hypothetical protein
MPIKPRGMKNNKSQLLLRFFCFNTHQFKKNIDPRYKTSTTIIITVAIQKLSSKAVVFSKSGNPNKETNIPHIIIHQAI